MPSSTAPSSRLRRATHLSCLVSALLVVADSGRARAVQLKVSDDVWGDLHLLLQPTAQVRNEPGTTPRTKADFFLRRTRFMLGGQITRWVSFFAETDMPNWGKGGDWTAGTFLVQDAFVNFNIHRGFIVDAGMLILPFVHHARQGATNLNTLDYHGALVKYPAGSHQGWRDNGVEIRGLLFHDRLDYRLALTRGVGKPQVEEDLSDHVVPRFSGRVALNFLQPEEAFFLGGTYLGQKRVLSVGVAFDAQPGAYGAGQHYWALGGDVFLDLPLPHRRRLSGQLDVVGYGGAHPERGLGLLFDLGFAFGAWEPVVAVDWYRPTTAGSFSGQLLGLHGGLNWWFLGHTANLKLDLGFIKDPGKTMLKSATVGTLQTQAFF